ncbi:hypothetical protein FQN60_014134 [Etheostoma spectabile]|uniref:Myb-like domain-containing protein n=1 Tax=Etheostoma spectabile TaxID=54343 RepID=A0A5J5DB92_9PERO|nr:hypothetical protein FQN60_014134 [Etheostoma spectabile]
MDNTVVYSSRRNVNTTRTDLNLLLECLKFQMKCPDLQKQALLAIHSICEKREDNVDLLREMGGVAFVYNLSKSSIVRSDVKETALFTLGTLAEANVYCKNSLCRKETFADLADFLMKEDIPLTQKRVSVYLLSVLVANNKSGQTLGQTSGCLDILLQLFRTTSPVSTEATSTTANATQTYQLWASVSSALCGCVNNPQNEDGQRICVAAFPIIKVWLQQIALPRTEIFQPICSFIAMTVANNSSLASGLAQYGVVSHLFSLLTSTHLHPEDRLSVLLTLGHCTESSEEHQSQLVQCGGLPLIITLLTEDTSEEVRKAATFILQTCKQATMSLGVPEITARQGEGVNVTPATNMGGFRSSARELLRRIDLLEKRQAKEANDQQEDTEPLTLTKGLGQVPLPRSPPLLLPLQLKERIKTIPTGYRQNSTLEHIEAGGDNYIQTFRNVIKNRNDSKLKHMSSNISIQEEKAKTSEGDMWCSVCKGTGALKSSHLQSLEGGKEPHTADSQLFKPPAPVRYSVPKEIKCIDVEELQHHETSKTGKISAEERSLSSIRCAGCVLPFEEVTSRTFASLQSSCHHSCDMHKVLQEATDQFRTRHFNLLFRREYQDHRVEKTDSDPERVSAAEPQGSWENWREVCLTPIRKGTGKGKTSPPERQWKKHNGITLTPRYSGAKKQIFTSYNSTGPSLTPLKRTCLSEERRKGNKSGNPALNDEPRTSTDQSSTRRERKDFSREEVRYLLHGVKTYGFSWNTILWSYNFQPGRTNVDLAKKYRRLMARKRNSP